MPQNAVVSAMPTVQQGDTHTMAFELLGLEDPATDEGHVVEYTVGKERRGGRPLSATVRLMQGWRSADDPGTEIARFQHDDVQPNTDVIQQAVPPEGAARITDYSDLQLVVDFKRGAA